MQTTCPHCGSVFHVTPEILEMARGQARCNQCKQVFNALLSLENFTDHYGDPPASNPAPINETAFDDSAANTAEDIRVNLQQLTLNEAMYGKSLKIKNNYTSALWIAGILLLVITTVIQLIYYQRYQLVASSNYQQQILNLCQIMPCNEARFSNPAQIKLIERNVYSHPTRENALMITGSFVNQASFSQPAPDLLVSLSDTQGQLIANRLFDAEEYLTDQSQKTMQPGKAILFQLEIFDPGTQALTYEFEFIS